MAADELEVFRSEITTLFYNAWSTSDFKTIPVAWPKREFDSAGKESWIRFNLTLGDEERSSIGGASNYFTQRGYVVIQYYAPVVNNFSDDLELLGFVKSVFRNAETDSTRFLSAIMIDGPVESAPWMLYTVTARFDGTLFV